MILKLINPHQLPLDLLMEADPDQQHIQSYLDNGMGFAVIEQNTILGGCICVPHSRDTIELINIAIWPQNQQQSLGSKLLRFCIKELKQQGYKRIELGTGSFGHQLSFYKRAGFRVEKVLRDHFLNNYPEPIFEHGIQHKDMLWLGLDLR